MKQRTHQLFKTDEPVSVQIQSILYHNELSDLERTLASLARTAELSIAKRLVSHFHLYWGDCSPGPCLSPKQVACLREKYASVFSFEYTFFGENLGSARGHNTLAKAASTDFLFICNPDVVSSPDLFEQLLRPFTRLGIGIVEGKQLPFEHPKDYDKITGETSWASTACALVPLSLFHSTNGFDADSFFLYCDDVDFSWRVRLAGYRVIHQPAALVFHDKRLSDGGAWQPSNAEHYYSAEAALFLAHKWSRPDLVDDILLDFKSSDSQSLRKAVKAFEQKRDNGDLPAPLDSAHEVGQFVGAFYAKHRFKL